MIHNISIATDDDIIKFGNDVNIYTVYLSRAIIIWGNWVGSESPCRAELPSADLHSLFFYKFILGGDFSQIFFI